MYDGNDSIRLEVPRPTGFAPAPMVVNPNATNNFVANIAAMQDPSGTLERLQSEQVIKGMADLKTDGIDQLYKAHALNAIDEYQKYATGLYKQNKGFNRLNLSGQQKLDDAAKYRKLLMDVNALKGMSEDYRKTLTQAAADVRSGIITPEAYNAFEKELNDRNTGAKGIGELPLAHAVYNKYLSKYATQDWLKKLDDMMRVPMEAATKRTTSEQQSGKWFDVVNYDPIPDVMPLVQMNPEIERGLSLYTGGDPAKAQQFLRDRYNANSRKLAPGQGGTHIYNNGYGVSQSRIIPVPYVKEGNKTVWDFPKKDIPYTKDKVSGYLTAVYNEGGKWYGEFSVDEMVESPNKSTFDINNKKVPNRFGNDVYPVELDASDFARVMSAGYDLEDGDKFGWKGMKEQRNRTSKAKPAGPVEITPEIKQRLSHASTTIITPSGEMKIAQLKRVHGLTDDEIINGIKNGMLSIK